MKHVTVRMPESHGRYHRMTNADLPALGASTLCEAFQLTVQHNADAIGPAHARRRTGADVRRVGRQSRTRRGRTCRVRASARRHARPDDDEPPGVLHRRHGGRCTWAPRRSPSTTRPPRSRSSTSSATPATGSSSPNASSSRRSRPPTRICRSSCSRTACPRPTSPNSKPRGAPSSPPTSRPSSTPPARRARRRACSSATPIWWRP